VATYGIQGKNMTKSPHFFARALLGALILTTATASYALEGGRLAKEATITLDQARDAAMKAQPGKILDQELEHRKAGSGLRYSFDIKVGTVTHEVGIDAKTGSVLQNSAEGNK
jgi:uncharacterized membrane protein YkoI